MRLKLGEKVLRQQFQAPWSNCSPKLPCCQHAPSVSSLNPHSEGVRTSARQEGSGCQAILSLNFLSTTPNPLSKPSPMFFILGLPCSPGASIGHAILQYCSTLYTAYLSVLWLSQPAFFANGAAKVHCWSIAVLLWGTLRPPCYNRSSGEHCHSSLSHPGGFVSVAPLPYEYDMA